MENSITQVTFQQLQMGRYMDLDECLKMEFNISQHMMVRTRIFFFTRSSKYASRRVF